MTADGPDVSATLRDMLRDGEELHWHYRPPRDLYVRQSFVGGVVVGLVLWSVPYGVLAGFLVVSDVGQTVAATLGIGLPVALAAGWVVVQGIWAAALGGTLGPASRRLEYAATDQRVIKIGGLVGLDTSAVEWPNVTDVEVQRTALTNLFGTGNVRVRTPGGDKTYLGGGVQFNVVTDPMAAVGDLEAIQRGEVDGSPILTGRGQASAVTTSVGRERLSSQARYLLHDDEAVVWHGRPAFLPYVGPWLVIGAAVVAVGVGGQHVVGDPFFWLVALSGLIYAGRRVLEFRNAEYISTSERVLAFGGVLGRDSSSVAWSDVQDVEIEVGPVDGPFGTGTLRFSRAGGTTAQERRQSPSDTSRYVFAGVQFERVLDPRGVAATLEAARADR